MARVTDRLLLANSEFGEEGVSVDDELSVPDKLRANAALVVRLIRENLDTELDYDLSGVEWIDGYINRLRASLPMDKRSGLISTLASFVGESIIRTYGGTWVEQDGWWGVQVSERIWACPFAKVEKQFENGPEESVASFFTCIPILDTHLDNKHGESGVESDQGS
jgi:hypothetical protein